MGSDDDVEKVMVAAIDIGDKSCGYAFSFKHEYQRNPSELSRFASWNSPISPKAPTVVLFDESKKFHSFGYEADETYLDLALENKHHKWYFFKQFRKRLSEKKITGTMDIEDCNGKRMNAIDVFGAVIKYLKDHLLDLLNKRQRGIANDDIHWVLPVPATWTDSATQFMRNAAYRAGIDNGQLSIASEPETASLFCQYTQTDKMHVSEGDRFTVTSLGTKFMVIDLGYTTNITVYEPQAGGGLKELYKSSGGALGSTSVDEEFFALLAKIVGSRVFRKCIEDPEVYIYLQREFEIRKRTIRPDSSGKVSFKVPVAIAEIYKDETNKNLKEAIGESAYSGKIAWVGDKMRIEAQMSKDLFKPCTDQIVAHIKDVLKQPDVKGTNIFLMVGGFSESVMIQDAIKKALPKGNVINPYEAGLAVLKGAVIYGHCHGNVS